MFQTRVNSDAPIATFMNTNASEEPPQWNSEPMFQLPPWGEPLIVLTILVSAMIATRTRGFQVFDRPHKNRLSILDKPRCTESITQLLSYDPRSEDGEQDAISASSHQWKKRYCFGMVIWTPNTSRFAGNLHSRIMQRFPFLVEMFYWIVTYFFYRMTKLVSQKVFSKTGIWDVALQNGLRVLEIEQSSWLSFLFPWTEHDVQQWFMHGHQSSLTALNRFYALVHIPGTVGFIAWYYYSAPSHSAFATVRRTLTLTNLLAFVIFTFYPCMPPRLLPPEYGFVDSVRRDNARSIWMSGNYVNSLAAMPSMHFGYSFCIGCALLHHAGIFQRTLGMGDSRKTTCWKLWYLALALAYPLCVLAAIIATANHYWLDALAAVVVACAAFLCNRVFLVLLPVEDLLYWSLRMEKPTPSTGEQFRSRGGSI
ncbi:integral membrane protein [Histoplasma ohiense]|nr:integral membrane protein [Histoplasma ohiense (nom. inval.)]